MKYPLPESKNLELKETPSDFQKLIRTCTAFANGTGGKIVIGVEDSTLCILGVEQSVIEHMMESFPQAVYQATSPPIFVEIMPQDIAGKTVLNITVPRGMRNIFCVKSEGKPKGVYVRVGRTTTRAPLETYEELLALSSFVHYDERILDVSRQILANDSLARIYGKKLNDGLLISEKILGHNQSGGSLRPSVAAILMFCENPEEYIPEALIKVTHFRGTAGRDIIATRDIKGPIPRVVEESIALCLEWTEVNLKLTGVQLKGEFRVPEAALREAVLNAVIHRKYSIAGAIKIAIYQDRMEVFSPGDIPSPLTLQCLGDGSTALRNPLIAKLAHKMRLVEKLGSGVRLIYEECSKYQLKKPEFREDGDFVKVIFYFEKRTIQDKTQYELAHDLLNEKSVISTSDLVRTGIPRRTASAILKRLVDEGYAKKIGELKGSKYLKI